MPVLVGQQYVAQYEQTFILKEKMGSLSGTNPSQPSPASVQLTTITATVVATSAPASGKAEVELQACCHHGCPILRPKGTTSTISLPCRR